MVVYGNFYTADKKHPKAEAVAILRGRFAYVGDAEGAKEFIGKKTKVLDYSGKFIMPGIIDSHIHIPLPVGLENVDIGPIILCDGKKAILDFVAEHIKNNPGLKRYRFMMEKKHLMGEDIVKEDLDAICPDAELPLKKKNPGRNPGNSVKTSHFRPFSLNS